MKEFIQLFGKDTAASVVLDVTNNDTIEQALAAAAIAFGGVDIVVNNAGISISKSIAEHSIADWDKLYDILVKGYGDFSFEQRYTIIGDTSLIDEYVNGTYSHTMREYKKGDKVKIRQIIKPEMSQVINTFYYDEFGNEIRYERTENGETEESPIEYMEDK